ncbi:MAG TPA: hypothetical protein VE826_07540 [Dongiaceae bacterium]|nr:hypothetical protein [Dongiaceae bacterium]
MICCDDPKFAMIEELGHVESVDWDLGTCKTCGSYLLQQWSEYAPATVYLDKLSAEDGEYLKTAERRARLTFLKQWYADH